jgi:hypothetical protein
MAKERTPKEIMASTTPQVRKVVSEILKIENEYKGYRDLAALKDKEVELCDRIVRLLEQEIKQ